MAIQLTRRAAPLAAALAVAGVAVAEEERDYPAPKFVPKRKNKSLSYTLVQDFVIFAHSDLDMVKKLYEKEPAVLNATVDWGAGDWESALGGASHMGRRDIAEFLIERGARVDLFAAAMLGHLEVIQTLLKAQPKLIDARGPHGFNLYFHARAGRKQSEPVLKYLQSIRPEPAPKIEAAKKKP